MSNANATQVGGSHYKAHGDSDLQHWDIVHKFKLDYFQGQITRYVFRWRDKNGLEDLHKAAHFLQKYIELNTPSQEDIQAQLELLPRLLGDSDPVKTYHVGEVLATGWAQFLFEGTDAYGTLYTCRTCKQKFLAPPDQNPHDYHGCHDIPNQCYRGMAAAAPEGDATPAYVKQE
ncbi:MAG: DUF3310 domain-containing protein [Candidatus Hydrogenedentes bacterium]|nr:DUF3310 domain-containing protein [Candidatus Hydrogenedentota bacterium]